MIIIFCFFSCDHHNSNSAPTKKPKQQRTELVTPRFHKGHNLWTGSKVENKIQYICGIEFKNQDSLKIEYRLDFLEDWVQKKEVYGKAHFVSTPAVGPINIIAYQDTFQVFCFQDTINNLRILFSKNDTLAPMLSQVQHFKNGVWNDTTMVMHQK